MIIGFTGTRKGMTKRQLVTVEGLMTPEPGELGADWAASGDCRGADDQFHDLAVKLGIKTWGFPPLAWPVRRSYDRVEEPAGFIDRDHNIVNASASMIAAPKGYIQEWRGSGTWATIRYALKVGVPLTIVWPDGSTGTSIHHGY